MCFGGKYLPDLNKSTVRRCKRWVMWEGDEGSRVSIKEIGSFPGMSAVLEAPGADAFHP